MYAVEYKWIRNPTPVMINLESKRDIYFIELDERKKMNHLRLKTRLPHFKENQQAYHKRSQHHSTAYNTDE
jgi:hypothetical protein